MPDEANGRGAPLPPELAAWIGRESEPLTLPDVVSDADLRRYANALDDANPLWQDDAYARDAGYAGRVAPPCLVLEFFRPPAGADENDERGLRSPGGVNAWGIEVPVPPEFTRLRRGEDDVEWFAPVRPGDRITVRQRVADIQLKAGRSGALLLITRENEFVNQRGELLVRQRVTSIRRRE